MNTALMERASAELSDKIKPNQQFIGNVTQNGQNSLNVEYAREIIENLTVLAANGSDTTELDRFYNNSLVSECCNLFIIKDETFNSGGLSLVGSFLVPRNKALTHESNERFDPFDERNKKYPSLFITANGTYNGVYQQCKPGQAFYYGVITEVTPQGKNIKVCFRRLFCKALSQERLNEVSDEIGINSKNGVDMLNYTNWLIKRLDIRKILTDYRITYF